MAAASSRALGREVLDQRFHDDIRVLDAPGETVVAEEARLIVVGAAGVQGGALVRFGVFEAVDRVQVVAGCSESVKGGARREAISMISLSPLIFGAPV